ncbi:MAG TPA: hypothetical protein VNE17_03655 [Nitrolancea sp.]|nr:hypothetical protein [Nitrolancea sp.]
MNIPFIPPVQTLAQAVAAMTAAARREGRARLILSEDEWIALVLRHMYGPDPRSFTQEIIDRVGQAANITALNRWLMLATGIWNATPQPDRDGKSANELLAEERPHPGHPPRTGRPRPMSGA